MKAAVLEGPGMLVVREVPEPTVRPGDLLVKVEGCGICRSDVRLWQSGRSDLLTLPAIIGHEAVGVVTEVGDADDRALLGSRVFVDGFGGFAEYTRVTAAMRERQHGPFLLPDAGLAWDAAVFAEPLADCLYAVEYCAEPAGARRALVAGCGQMGLQIVRLLVLRGMEVIALDPLPERRALARRFGAVAALSPAGAQQPAGPSPLVDVDIAFVACASVSAVTSCLAALACGGTCVLFSALPAEPAPIDLDQIHKRRLRIVGSRWVAGRREPRYELYRTAITLLSSGLVDVAALTDRRVGFDTIAATFTDVTRLAVMKAVLHPDGDLSPR